MNKYKKIICIILIGIVFFVPNLTFAFLPNDTFYDRQWYLEKIKAPEAWDKTFGNKTVIVAVVDTGIDVNHPDINFWRNTNEIPNDGIDNDKNGYIDDVRGWNFVDNDNNLKPDIKNISSENKEIIHHATIVSGIIGGIPNNGVGISGVSWKAEIMPLKIANTDGYTTTSIISEAILYAVDNGAGVINVSLVSVDNFYDEYFRNAVQYAYDKNVVVVSASGNGNKEIAPNGFDLNVKPVYPACFKSSTEKRITIGVSATDKNDNKTSFSNYGSSCVDVSAPGVEVFSTLYTENLTGELYGGNWFGTSFSAPLVSGAVAYAKSINPQITIEEVIKILRNSGDNIILTEEKYSGQLGTRLNLLKVVEAVLASVVPEEKQVKDTIIEDRDKPQKQTIVFGNQEPNIFYGAHYSNGLPEVVILNDDMSVKNRFFAFNPWETDGLDIKQIKTTGNLPGVVVAPNKNGESLVRIFTDGGVLLKEFNAYSKTFKGGVNLAVGNIDFDSDPEIITAPKQNGGPHIRIFDKKGKLKYQFFAHNKSYRGGLQIAVGDINGDSVNEIIVGLGQNEEPIIKVFNFKGELIKEFNAYAKTFKGGVSVGVADLNNDGKDEIITGAKKGGGPHIRIFNESGILINQFFAYDKLYRGGILLEKVDLNRDGKYEILVSPQSSGESKVKVFDINGTLLKEFIPFDKFTNSGVSISWR